MKIAAILTLLIAWAALITFLIIPFVVPLEQNPEDMSEAIEECQAYGLAPVIQMNIATGRYHVKGCKPRD